MAITQPGGAGGTILFEDDTHADASLDGVAGAYSPEDLYQKSQANSWKAALTAISCTTNGTTLLQSAAAFGGMTYGASIAGADIPANTTVQYVIDTSNLVMTNAATGASTASRNFGITPAVEKWGGAVFGLIADYWFHVNTQNGDGVGTATTTFKATRCRMKYDATKTHLTSATGLANRWTKFGTLQESVPFDPIGYDGVDMTVGAGMTIDGNHQLYGSELRLITAVANQRIAVQRASTSAAGDCVSLTVEMLATASGSTIRFGSSGIRTARARHIYLNCIGNATTGNVEIFNVADADDVHFGGITNVRLGAVNAPCFGRGFVFAGTPGTADMRGSNGGTDLVDAKWSGVAPQVQLLTVPTRDWRTFSPVSQNVLTGAVLAGDTMNLYDKNGTLVIGPIVSDGSGQFSYSLNTATGIAVANAVIARQAGTGAWVENGPFTAVYSKAGYADTTVVFSWPRSTGAFGDQLYGVFDVVPRRPLTVGPTADFRWTPGGGSPGISVQFTDESLAGDSAITSRFWEFGDGVGSTLASPTHVYAAAGSFGVRLTVTTALGTNAKFIPAAVVVVENLSPFRRRTGPTTAFTPVAQPTGSFTPTAPTATTYERAADPTTGFAPCGGVVAPTFRHRGATRRAFRRKGAVDPEFEECGTPPVVEETIIFPGVTLPLE